MDSIRVLVVDDEPSIRDILERSLTIGGYQVCVADDGKSAIEACKNFSPHVMLLDMVLPDLGGMDILRKIREMDSSVKVVMVSGMQDLQIARDAKLLGAVDFITKPFDLRTLDSFIKGIMSNES
jgi:DNA-binding response OmpR family regulator